MRTTVFLVLVLICFAGNSIKAQSVQWTAFEDLNDSLNMEIKPVMIFIHADWCKFCHMQEATTFSDSSSTEFLKNFYCLKLNSEHQHSINFLGRSFDSEQISDGKYSHELATFFYNDQPMTLPGTVFLDQDLKLFHFNKGLLTIEGLNILFSEEKE